MHLYKIMIIDDEKLICQGVHSKINRIGHPLIGDVYESTDPIHAINEVRNLKPDIIITDMEMPGMTGLDLISEIIDILPEMKFIVLSGHDNYNYVRSSFQLGVIDYILKPLTLDELSNKLNQTIELLQNDDQLNNPLNARISNTLNLLTTSSDPEKKKRPVSISVPS